MANEIENLMAKLKISEAEAKEVLAYDKAVDEAKATDKLEFDLTAEQKQNAKEYLNMGKYTKKQPKTYNLKKRERKKNETKQTLISALAEFLPTVKVEGLQIVNAERQITFSFQGNDYELNLIQKRKKKT